ncbi:hypothetical protein T459_30885 [Capsicum annuum]|uniref:Uncharacterized protein n=1 Tax=Capsicum annuum TaxID=4072 RepID=A0A2G2Y9P4_CAPAN|nr:hypothetical protein T459_30885 [Capsicum annuum]
MSCIYIPFETLWNAYGNKEGKNPNDYYLFEVFEVYAKELCREIRLEYENIGDGEESNEQCKVPNSFQLLKTILPYMVLEPSIPSSSRASAECDIATDR